ncbi:TorF family putative porin [Phenylobacterium sp. LjRoot225]|uniref:TorF family putative porin n=1 Tax=Phenylobacterium sp. LjRoot225 TaxID=3342285 RepID=UPI003ECC8AA9
MLAPMFAAAAAIAAPEAQATTARAIQMDYELGVVSDYRFRGVSLSDRKPALQAGARATFAGGAYVDLWGSTIEDYASEGDTSGARVEVDVSLGWAFQAAGLDIDLGIAAYAYPRAEDLSYLEAPISLSRAIGVATVTLGGAYAPSQSALGHKDNAYVYGSVGWRAGPVELTVQSGYEDGAFAPGGKWDWSASAARAFGPVRAELSYVDADEPGGSAALVAGLAVGF